jgi:hypothetical protein
MNDDKLEAVQAVVDRVTSWQDGATEGTVAAELRKGFDEVGVQVAEDDVARLADAIEDKHGAVSAADVLAG